MVQADPVRNPKLKIILGGVVSGSAENILLLFLLCIIFWLPVGKSLRVLTNVESFIFAV